MDIQFPQVSTDFPQDRWHQRRFRISLSFLERHIPRGSEIIDLGTHNGLSELIQKNGYFVDNTTGEDLDLNPDFITPEGVYDCVTAFEILEHLVSPFELLRMLPSRRLVASVPLRLWFAKAYNRNEMDRHFHEFEAWQFDWLLEKAGWKIVAREYHTSPTMKLGFRSILRWVTPRWYFVYCERV
jgi:hypothetical protein